jgi:nucleoside-diphosphate kinase
MTMTHSENDQTLVLIKPDALKNSLTGYVLSLLSEVHTGLRYAGAKVVNVHPLLAEEHYAEHRDKAFYGALIEYITGVTHYPDRPHRRRVIALVFMGSAAVEKIRNVAGPTNPHKARDQKPGCIRSLGTVVHLQNEKGESIGDRMDNLIHASATPPEAEREIKLWFKPSDIPPAMRVYATRLSERLYFFKDDKLLLDYEPGAVCMLAPGDVGWASDIEALEAIRQGQPSAVSLRSVAAKYLTNEALA